MEPTKELLDSIERERIERARRMNPIEKMFAGAALYDAARDFMALGVRALQPELSDEAVERTVDERIEHQRRREAAA